MTTITLDAIKAEHSKLTEMIAAFEAQAKLEAAYPITIAAPALKPGEKHVGIVISADGTRKHHIILLPGEKESVNWKDAMTWAASVGGELPDRVEGALLFQAMKGEFKEEWYWTREPYASDSGYAWSQDFDGGSQGCSYTISKFRARAVRRLEIQ